jgi:ABC-type dipeptide/oligopeptide/nickel transport system ATPase component
MHIDRGEIVGVVGESGSGKSVTAMLAMRLLPPASYQIHSGQVTLMGNDILKASEQEMRDIRGRRVAMIFQEPMTALNPTRRIGKQMVDVIRQHRPLCPRGARQGGGAAGGYADRRSAAGDGALPLRTLRRDAPAGDDRHRLFLRARPADCR